MLIAVTAFVGVGAFLTKPVDAVLPINWTCKLAQNADGSGSAEIWGNLRKPIYFTETQAHYVIEREGDTLIKPNTGQPWLPFKSLSCSR